MNAAQPTLPSMIAVESTGTTRVDGTDTSEHIERFDAPDKPASKGFGEWLTLAAMFRMGGALLIVASMSLFLMQGFNVAGSDLHRFGLLLSQAALLALAGFAVGYVLREPRGARVFLGLGLVSVPANFAVLGALVYSIVPMDTLLAQYPTYAKWQVASTGDLVTAVIIGSVVLIPMTLFGFAVMARRSFLWLTAALLLSSSSLLLPVRDALPVTVISCVVVIALLMLLIRKGSGPLRTTREERFACTLLFVPPVLMLCRSAMLYNVDLHFGLAPVIALHCLIRHALIRAAAGTVLHRVLGWLSALSAVVLAAMVASLCVSSLGSAWLALAFSLVLGVLYLDLARCVIAKPSATGLHLTWAMLTAVLLCMPSLGWVSVWEASLGVLLAVVVIASGTLLKHPVVVLLGVLSLLAQFAWHADALWRLVLSGGWILVAVLGGTAILVGSLLERFGPQLRVPLALSANADPSLPDADSG